MNDTTLQKPSSPKDGVLILNKYSSQQKHKPKEELIEHDKAKQPYKKERAKARKKKYHIGD